VRYDPRVEELELMSKKMKVALKMAKRNSFDELFAPKRKATTANNK
jgi:hypothetical protein